MRKASVFIPEASIFLKFAVAAVNIRHIQIADLQHLRRCLIAGCLNLQGIDTRERAAGTVVGGCRNPGIFFIAGIVRNAFGHNVIVIIFADDVQLQSVFYIFVFANRIIAADLDIINAFSRLIFAFEHGIKIITEIIALFGRTVADQNYPAV